MTDHHDDLTFADLEEEPPASNRLEIVGGIVMGLVVLGGVVSIVRGIVALISL